ncbi:zinc-binding dehydrogenase [Kribbella kalugense]|uniref:zinc-binding dehydrogenase n=1 Tax=Kribbella kalugense TaxID=2512221 RepID=UPI001EDEE0B7|nr:zinc-binding dehydrogenase [Kribbella kalugense]
MPTRPSTQVDFAEVLSDVDAVLDTIGGDYGIRSLRVLRRGGTLVSLSGPNDAPPRELADEHHIRSGFMLVEPDYAALKAIASLAAAGRLRAEIGTVVPLAEAAKAHVRGETGRTTGKIVLTVAPAGSASCKD